ncbi:LemA family protein [Parashewanella spongiae]|uniref:LemA family protein n=1 Tax=Parashewanella spongiae TaxID=342950 RepID=UPI001404A9C8|nr:LemA family protein [Parashewanella spongiae]MCL1078074.1 LemA family protein [Parashewanella spongiae]
MKKSHTATKLIAKLDNSLKQQTLLAQQVIAFSELTEKTKKVYHQQLGQLQQEFNKPYKLNDYQKVKSHLKRAGRLSYQINQTFMASKHQPNTEPDSPINTHLQKYYDIHSSFSTICRHYNQAVTELNLSVSIFPSSLIAFVVNIHVMPYFEPKMPASLSPSYVYQNLEQLS